MNAAEPADVSAGQDVHRAIVLLQVPDGICICKAKPTNTVLMRLNHLSVIELYPHRSTVL